MVLIRMRVSRLSRKMQHIGSSATKSRHPHWVVRQKWRVLQRLQINARQKSTEEGFESDSEDSASAPPQRLCTSCVDEFSFYPTLLCLVMCLSSSFLQQEVCSPGGGVRTGSVCEPRVLHRVLSSSRPLSLQTSRKRAVLLSDLGWLMYEVMKASPVAKKKIITSRHTVCCRASPTKTSASTPRGV